MPGLRSWGVNEPEELAPVIRTLDGIASSYSGTVSFADLVVLAGCPGVEKAAADAGHRVTGPFTPGRTDATQEMTDEESFSWMEPSSDGFRNFAGKADRLPAEYLLVDRANLLTRQPGTLSNDFFSSLLDMSTSWVPAEDGSYERRDAAGQADARDGLRHGLGQGHQFRPLRRHRLIVTV